MSLFELEAPELYSIAIIPPNNIVATVRSFKKILFDEFGWYPSCHSSAHITINKFEATHSSLLQWEKSLSAFCEQKVPFEISLKSTDSFTENGTFYLKLNSETEDKTTKLMSVFHLATKQLKPNTKVSFPHLSIARKGLTRQQIEIAKELIKPIDMTFVCDSLCIRKYNEQKRQYELYRRIQFSGV